MQREKKNEPVGNNTYSKLVLEEAGVDLAERMQKIIEESENQETSSAAAKAKGFVGYAKYINGIATALAPLNPEVGPLLLGSIAMIVDVCEPVS